MSDVPPEVLSMARRFPVGATVRLERRYGHDRLIGTVVPASEHSHSRPHAREHEGIFWYPGGEKYMAVRWSHNGRIGSAVRTITLVNCNRNKGAGHEPV